MKPLNSKLLLAAIFSMAVVTKLQAQQISDVKIGYVEPNLIREQPAIGPSFVLAANGGILVADEANREVKIFRTPDFGSLVGSIPYPSGIQGISNMSVNGGELILVGGDALEARLPVEFGLETSRLVDFSGNLSDAGELRLKIDGAATPKIIASEADRSIVDWQYVGSFEGRHIVAVNEIASDDLVAQVISINGDEIFSVGSFSWSMFDFLPNSALLLSEDGVPWVIGLRDGKWSHRLSDIFEADRSLAVDPNRRQFFEDVSNAEVRQDFDEIVEAQRQVFDDSLADRAISDYTVIDHSMLKFAEIADFPLRSPSGISRETAVARALAYYTIPYFYRIRNAKDLGAGWEKPTNLVGKISTWQRGFRYYWSGYMSLKRHQEGIVAGHAVGDINTGTIISSGIVGCDCSGCVSAWLGISRHTTTGIADDPDDLFKSVSLVSMRPGDIFNKKGSHVRMLLNKIQTANGTRYRVIESAKSCDGVCIKTYSAGQLGAYRPLTYRKFTN